MADFATWDRKTLEAFAADALERMGHQGDQLAKLRPLLDECAPYLKEGETPLQRIERDAKDAGALTTLLAAEKRKSEALAGELEALRPALAELVALKDLKERLRQLHEKGHGTDYGDYHRRKPLAWAAARAAAAMKVTP